jgi:pimeloyl-ACP methyl ester carboxylesterase
MPKVKVGDINMYYEVQGQAKGEPLVLIAGMGGDLTSWTFQEREFSKKYKVILFDNRGAGRTDAPDKPYSIRMMADDTVGLLTALNIQNAHIVGVSMGGYISLELAINYPQKVKSLSLLTAAADQTPVGRYFTETRVKMAQEGVSPETLTMYSLLWVYTDKFFEDPKRVQAAIDARLNWPYKQPLYALARQVEACARHRTKERLSQITAPTLVLVGKEDILLPVKVSEVIAAGIPNAKLVILEGGGHGFCTEIPHKVNHAVLNFLTKVTRR